MPDRCRSKRAPPSSWRPWWKNSRLIAVSSTKRLGGDVAQAVGKLHVQLRALLTDLDLVKKR